MEILIFSSNQYLHVFKILLKFMWKSCGGISFPGKMVKYSRYKFFQLSCVGFDAFWGIFLLGKKKIKNLFTSKMYSILGIGFMSRICMGLIEIYANGGERRTGRIFVEGCKRLNSPDGELHSKPCPVQQRVKRWTEQIISGWNKSLWRVYSCLHPEQRKFTLQRKHMRSLSSKRVIEWSQVKLIQVIIFSPKSAVVVFLK